tara:strand:+ start:84 stop:785 length:702 start_codon:yes stop_codon:yes gene_type:complete
MESIYCPKGSYGHPDFLCLSFKGFIIFCIISFIIYYFINVHKNTNNQFRTKINNISNEIYNNSEKIKIKKEKKKLQIDKQKLLEQTILQQKQILDEKNKLIQHKQQDMYSEPTKIQDGVPINIQTRGVAPQIQQLGSLTKLNHTNTSGPGTSLESIILPLMGRRPYNRSHNMIYYTLYNNIKIPLNNSGKSCDTEYGCNELFDNDVINIPELNGSFKINIYQNQQLQYIPYLG